ncbi:NAD(P)-dependent dehydrogenase (short-subunit alcohol dehydrogenase family) [Silvimonas terrae]|uniref:NAD(P)-dependent dehydrogenase (Short-subunit alcohol dehydrogenase family) n=1 Tax=Silvimonas terrae TaxID=300266 RepID=A0A840RLV5_9NEIS|nr:SDR family oxidoreductase [Silvimonas terrae]MBB5193508.1 NAD(P)-dependent dehydrogenase (short-subunit alcohol dehydrogenase family) [Silvimonas terrae]
MSTVLITGAGRGIGLEFATQYLQDNWRVIVTVREVSPALSSLQIAWPDQLKVILLDITDWPGVAALGQTLADERIDLLINNAGFYGGNRQDLGHTEVETWLQTLAIDTIAPIKVVEAVLPRLASHAKIATLTSKMGSIADNHSGAAYHYRSAKAGLNAAVKSLALDLGRRHTVLLFHPGWVQTDMGGPGALVTPEESVAGMRRIIHQAGPDESGHFYNFDGTPLPW